MFQEDLENLLKRGVSRRRFLAQTLVGLLTLCWASLGTLGRMFAATGPPPIHRPKDPNNLTEFERLHVPRVRMPEVIEDGANVPCFVEMDHPMEPDHFITRVQILNYQDPLIWKGTFHFTPESGSVYLYSQLRLDSGKSTVYAIAECNRHGFWVGSAVVDVAVGGC